MVTMPEALVICTILATIIVALIKIPFKKHSNGSNPGRRGVSEKVCDERHEPIETFMKEIREDIKSLIGSVARLEGSKR